MHATNKIVSNLGQFAANYTRDLVMPFEDNIEANADAETPLLIISDVCKLIGLTQQQTYLVLGKDGSEFVEYLEAGTYIAMEPSVAVVRILGRTIPIAGTVGDGGKVNWNEWATKKLGAQ